MKPIITHIRVFSNPQTGFLLRQNSPMTKNQTIDKRSREILANNLTKLMGERGLTDAGLEEMSGVGRSTVQRVRKQETSPTLDNIAAIAKALKIKLSDLLSNGGRASVEPERPSVAVESIVDLISVYGRVHDETRNEILEFAKSLEERDRLRDLGAKEGDPANQS